ncbi:MAG: hypothetical protein ABR887_03865 [Methanoregulaceae archaeon]
METSSPIMCAQFCGRRIVGYTTPGFGTCRPTLVVPIFFTDGVGIRWASGLDEKIKLVATVNGA